VDNTKEFTHLGLCAGYGGIELGLHRVIRNLRSVALCEIEAFACANLVAKMEAGLMDCAPIWTDLKTFPWAEFCDRVDILTGGYPCQPFSAAGKRLGTEDPRHLWPFIASGIRILRPKLCFFENVEGHISLGLREVIGDLEAAGYTAAWGIFSASEVGAPHQRKRVFILAYDSSVGIQGCGAGWLQEPRPHAGQGLPLRGGDAGRERGEVAWPSRPGEPQHTWEPPRVVADAHQHGNRAGLRREAWQGLGELHCQSGGLGNAESEQGSPRNHGGESGKTSDTQQIESGRGDCGSLRDCDRQAEPALGRDAHGATDWMDYAELQVSCDNRTDELRLLGNGVVPATAERAFLTLWEELLKGTN
jgi:DNA (cytosine-5)-methyltransferase 1